jgi:hypothetical protein
MTAFLVDAVNELDGLAQAVEIQQVGGDSRWVEIC